jgi:geranylgeranyl pyrophosphate synthase
MLLSETAILAALDEAFSLARLSTLGDGAAATLSKPIWNQVLQQPLENFLRHPGKTLRAELLETSFNVANYPATEKRAAPLEALLIVEALHAGSLIVDDIEDDSTVRRGMPTLHCAYGLPRALNAGNWLYFWPFALLERLQLSETLHLKAYRLVTSVLSECHYGQALDVSLRIEQLPSIVVPNIAQACSELKTGSLFGLAAGLGALLGGADEKTFLAIQRYGRTLGVALQMLDDLSSLLDEKKQHKVAEDLRLGRVTWPWAWIAPNIDSTLWSSLLEDAVCVRQGARAETLTCRLVEILKDRGQTHIHQRFEAAWAELEKTLGDLPHQKPLRTYQDRVYDSYLSHREVA